MDPLIPVPQCPVTEEVLSNAALTAAVKQLQANNNCLQSGLVTLDRNIREVLRVVQEMPRPAVCPTSIICINDVVFGYTADAGESGDDQDLLSEALKLIDPRAVFFAGDNVYETPSTENVAEAWNAFRWLINTERAFYALGNHDIDDDPLGSYTTALFQSYIGGLRYYGKSFSDADLAAWFYNTGIDSGNDIQEPDMIEPGSVQYEWLQRSIKDSGMGFHILVAHIPPVSIINYTPLTKIYGPDLQPENLGVKLVLCGHSHSNEHLIYKGVHYLNISTSTQTVRTQAGPAPYEVYGESGVVTGDVSFQWGNTTDRCFTRITARQRDVIVEVLTVEDSTVVHEFRIPR